MPAKLLRITSQFRMDLNGNEGCLFALAAILFILLVFWILPPWVFVIAGAIRGILVS